MKTTILILLTLATITSSGLAVYFYLHQPAEKVPSAVTVAATDTSPVISLPSDAVKISECIPFMGEHWIQPSKLPIGPLYSVYNGKVTAIEYMFTPDKIPGEMGAKMSGDQAMAFMQKNNLSLADLVKANKFHLDTFGAKVHFVSIDWNMPHSGVTKPHYDLHAYLISESESEMICPDAKIEEVYSSEVLDNVKKYKIPFPEASAPAKSR